MITLFTKHIFISNLSQTPWNSDCLQILVFERTLCALQIGIYSN